LKIRFYLDSQNEPNVEQDFLSCLLHLLPYSSSLQATAFSKVLAMIGAEMQELLLKKLSLSMNAIYDVNSHHNGKDLLLLLTDLELNGFPRNGHPNNQFKMEESHNSLVRFVVCCLFDASTKERHQFLLNLLEQFLKFLHTKSNLDILHIPSLELRVLQESLWDRLRILNPFLATIKTQPQLCKYEEFAMMLMGLLSKSVVQINELLFDTILNLIDSLFSNSPEVKNENIKTKLRMKYEELNFQYWHRTQIEQTLPFLRPPLTPMITGQQRNNFPLEKTKKTIDPWTILEEYNDCPLSPSAFGATRIHRKEMRYSSSFFPSQNQVYPQHPLKRVAPIEDSDFFTKKKKKRT